MAVHAAAGGPPPSAYPRLRTAVIIENSLETLVGAFAEALREDGIAGHVCARVGDGAAQALFGDMPELVLLNDNTDVACDDDGLIVRLSAPPSAEARARVRGYAVLYAARGVELHAIASQPATACGLTVRQRFILGRLLLGDCPDEIAAASGASVAAIRDATRRAAAILGAKNQQDAVAIAARRGLLLTTETRFPALSPRNIAYYS
ncbi:hypothetical protein ACMT1E_01720 [Sphingomonas flavalba]|uniref:hypothetical protein n=1 Tax=Sphingomonas flavalba TaxID=2559804 RepID=UPI0039E14666